MADEDNKKTGDLLTAVQNRATKTRRDIAAAFERAKTQHRPSLAYLNEQTRSTREAITPILHVHHSVAKFAHSHWDQCDNDTKIQLAAVGGLAVGFFVAKTSAGVRSARARFRTVDDIPAAQFQQKVWLRTHVVKVADGDTIRVRHLPRWSRFNPREGSKLSEETLSVRLAAIDTPETAKFGKEGQPGGDEATQFLSDLILNQSVSIQLLSRDQYSRAVAMVYRGTWPFRKNVCKEMTAAGWATVYKQAGAQYGGELEAFERLEEEAKVSKLGVWGLKAAVESPAQYKARMRKELLGAIGVAQESFSKSDLNNDGKLSRKEWIARFGDDDLFDQYDADGDGHVDAAEWLGAQGLHPNTK